MNKNLVYTSQNRKNIVTVLAEIIRRFPTVTLRLFYVLSFFFQVIERYFSISHYKANNVMVLPKTYNVKQLLVIVYLLSKLG